MGLGGGMTRDVLVNQVPAALTDPAYITVTLAAGFIGYHLAFASGQLFREGLFQFMTSFSLPLYAIAGAQKGHQHVEASDDGRTAAAAEVITSEESGRTAQGAVALHRPHLAT